MSQDQAFVIVVTLVALLANFLTSISKADHLPDAANFFISVGISAAGGFVVLWTSGGLAHLSTPASYLTTVGAIVAESQVIYQTVWKHTIDNALSGTVHMLASKSPKALNTSPLAPRTDSLIKH